MLGLSSSVNSEEGYAKGERFRERWTDHVGTYNVVSNPIGFNGYDYMVIFHHLLMLMILLPVMLTCLLPVIDL